MSCKIFFMLILSSIIVFSCKKSELSEIKEGTNFRINYYTEDCVGEGQQECWLVQEGSMIGTSDWLYFYDRIEGFEYAIGYIYDLKVSKTAIANPLMDGSSIQYKLVEVLAKKKQ